MSCIQPRPEGKGTSGGECSTHERDLPDTLLYGSRIRVLILQRVAGWFEENSYIGYGGTKMHIYLHKCKYILRHAEISGLESPNSNTSDSHFWFINFNEENNKKKIREVVRKLGKLDYNDSIVSICTGCHFVSRLTRCSHTLPQPGTASHCRRGVWQDLSKKSKRRDKIQCECGIRSDLQIARK